MPMVRVSLICLAGILLSSCASGLKTSVSNAYFDRPYERVAVLGFSNAALDKDVSKAVTELFIADLFATQKYMLMERAALDKVLQEQGLSQSGILDPATAVRIGNLTGVDAAFVGSVTEYEYIERKHASLLWALIPPPPVWYFGMFLISEPKIKYKPGLSVRLVDTETGAIIWSADHPAIKKESLNDGEHSMAKRMLAKLPKPKRI